MAETTYTSDALFTGKDAVVQTIYTRLLEALHAWPISGRAEKDFYPFNAQRWLRRCASPQELSLPQHPHRLPHR
jgi:hypothetical protein